MKTQDWKRTLVLIKHSCQHVDDLNPRETEFLEAPETSSNSGLVFPFWTYVRCKAETLRWKQTWHRVSPQSQLTQGGEQLPQCSLTDIPASSLWECCRHAPLLSHKWLWCLPIHPPESSMQRSWAISSRRPRLRLTSSIIQSQHKPNSKW